MTKITKKRYVIQHLDRLIPVWDRIRTDSTIVKEILHDHIMHIPKMKLYKFRKCEECNFETLSARKIWMTKPADFDDLFDCTINIDLKRNSKKVQNWFKQNRVAIIINILNSHCEQIKLHYDVDSDSARKIYTQLFSPSGQLIQKKFEEYKRSNQSCPEINKYIRFIKEVEYYLLSENTKIVDGFVNNIRSQNLTYSMTEEFDNCSMWEHYADQYKGFCIEYNFKNFDQREFDHYKNLIYLFPIIYFKQIPSYEIIPILEASLLQDNPSEWNRDLFIPLNLQLLIKRNEYEYEKEWRFSIFNNNCNEQPFPYVSKLIAGRNISDENYIKLKNVACSLSVPIVRQTVDNSRLRYIYK